MGRNAKVICAYRTSNPRIRLPIFLHITQNEVALPERMRTDGENRCRGGNTLWRGDWKMRACSGPLWCGVDRFDSEVRHTHTSFTSRVELSPAWPRDTLSNGQRSKLMAAWDR